jgi:hypothetical protein
MSVNRLYFILVLSLLCASCVEHFEPELEETQEVLVVSGMISDSPGRHTVTVSLSSPYSQPVFQGIEFCVVNVTNLEGEMIHYIDEGAGVYSADIPDGYLEAGDAASLYVMTPDQGEYRSTFDTILPCPELDSLYWEFQYSGTSDPEISRPGIQFFLDMSGSPSDARNMIWRVNETWEYWASLFGNQIMWGIGRVEEYRSNEIFKCWKSSPLDQLYMGSTRNLTVNEIRRVPLNYVSNETDRLSVTYSLQVKQQSLTLEAYDYWQRMNEQAAESGGMYEKQPASVPGNIYPVEDTREVVLGYFYASQVKERRIFIHNNNFFDFYIPHIQCQYQPMSTFWSQGTIRYPVYIYSEGPFKPSWWGPGECFDCRLQGGDTIRPENWESWP